MITSIKVKDAKALVKELTERVFWRFTKIIDKEMVIRVNFYNESGFEYNRDVYVRASKDNRKLIVYVNKKVFPTWIRDLDLDEWIVEILKSYIDNGI